MAAVEADKMKMIQNLEIEMMADLYNRMTDACHTKCIPKKYHSAELNKGEAVCLDRCVAKYLDVHEKVGKRLTTISQEDAEQLKSLAS